MKNAAVIGDWEKVFYIAKELKENSGYHVCAVVTEGWMGNRFRARVVKYYDMLKLRNIRAVKKLTTREMTKTAFKNTDVFFVTGSTFQRMSDHVLEILKLGYSKNQIYIVPESAGRAGCILAGRGGKPHMQKTLPGASVTPVYRISHHGLLQPEMQGLRSSL